MTLPRDACQRMATRAREAPMDMKEIQRQLIRMRRAINALSDETGGTRTRAGDIAMSDAFGALAVLERETQTPVVAA